MRKLLSILAASLLLATAAQAQSTVPMAMTLHGNGTITGDLTGHLYGNGELDLTAPALTGAAVAGSFTGTCDSAHVLFGDGSCGTPPAPTSTQVVGAFTGTCSSTTYLNGGGSCTAPIITTDVTADETRTTTSGSNDTYLVFTGLAAGSYKISCMLTWGSIAGSVLPSASFVSSTETGFFKATWANSNNSNSGSAGGALGGTTAVIGGTSGTTTVFATMDGYTVLTSSGSTFALFWAANGAGGSLTLKAGSSCTLVKTA